MANNNNQNNDKVKALEVQLAQAQAQAEAKEKELADKDKQLNDLTAQAQAQAEAKAALETELEAAKAGGSASVVSSGISDDAGYVYVFANLPNGQAFNLPGGPKVVLNGYPVSLLKGPGGEKLPAGQYGVTRVKAALWDEVCRLYKDLVVMKSGLIFAAASEADGLAEARQRGGLRHGLEPIDPEGPGVATRPKKG